MAEWVTYDELTAAALNEKSVYIGSVAPSTKYDGMVWVDISTNPPILSVYDLTNTNWLTYPQVIYETDSGTWSDPVATPVNNGCLVVSYNDDQGETRIYARSNGAWANLDTIASPLEHTYEAVASGSISATGGTHTFANDCIINFDAQGSVELQMYSDDNSAWFDIHSDYVGRTLVVPGGKLRIINNGGSSDAYKELEIDPPGGISWDQGSLADQGTIDMAEGINSFYVAELKRGDIKVQYYYSSAWQDQDIWSLNDNFNIWSDGTNIRIINKTAGAIRYIHAYQTSVT